MFVCLFVFFNCFISILTLNVLKLIVYHKNHIMFKEIKDNNFNKFFQNNNIWELDTLIKIIKKYKHYIHLSN